MTTAHSEVTEGERVRGRDVAWVGDEPATAAWAAELVERAHSEE